jgi:hypothetical protein
MDTFLAVLKFTAIFSSGIWGAIGLIVDYKDDAGRPTRWGRRALIGVVLSTVIATAAQGVETYKQKQATAQEVIRAKAEESKTQNLLFEIKKAVYPIDNVFVHAAGSVRLEHPALARYAGRVHRLTRPLLAQEGGWESTSSVTLPRPVYPDRKTDRLAWRLLVDFGVELRFYKIPVSPSKYLSNRPKADLVIATHLDRPNSLYLRLANDTPPTIRVENYTLRADPRQTWASTGAIASILDLYGAQVFVEFRYDDADDGDDAIWDVMRQSVLDYVTLQVSEHQIVLHPWQECDGPNYKTYVTQFSQEAPASGVELRALRQDEIDAVNSCAGR